MNNDQFRKLLVDGSNRQNDASPPNSTAPSALGTKKSNFASTTPRSSHVSSADFARQVRERHAAFQPRKKFKSSAPKGSKLAAGYVDRAKARAEGKEEVDDKAVRIKALEEQVKLGNLPQETFESLRDEITGGDISSTHLVKGLDWKLLERVRRGEDVYDKSAEDHDTAKDVDEEFAELEDQQVERVQRERHEKKGTKGAAIAGVKRSRDEIMAELKAQRKAAAEAKAAAAPTLDSRWRMVGDSERPKIEIDRKGREVIVTVDEDGVVKRKVRKVPSASTEMPAADKPILGADAVLPEQPKAPQADQNGDDDDDDIFATAGTEYDPLGAEDEDDSNDDEDADNDYDSNEEVNANESKTKAPGEPARHAEVLDTESTEKPKAPRNYFNEPSNISEPTAADRFKGIEGILKKAAKLGVAISGEEDHSDSREDSEARVAKRAKMLANQDRDMQDMDLGFGSSRFEDEEDGDNGKIRLSEWRGQDEGWDEEEKGDKKKRKPKKRKGDANNMADIMRVIDRRKAGSSK